MAKYITESDATTYFDNNRLNHEAWDLANSSNRDKALTQATKIIDRLNLVGNKKDTTQSLEFPRDYHDAVPQEVKDATAEIALALLDGIDPQMEFENLFIERQSYSNIQASYNRDTTPPHIAAGVPSLTAWHLIRPFIRNVNDIQLERMS